jgi:hypothetical protein
VFRFQLRLPLSLGNRCVNFCVQIFQNRFKILIKF